MGTGSATRCPWCAAEHAEDEVDHRCVAVGDFEWLAWENAHKRHVVWWAVLAAVSATVVALAAFLAI